MSSLLVLNTAPITFTGKFLRKADIYVGFGVFIDIWSMVS